MDSGPIPFSPYQPPGLQSCSPASKRKIWTWRKVAELLNYRTKYGPVKTPEEKLEKTKGVRYIASPNDKPEKGNEVYNHQYWWLLEVKKGVPRDVMEKLTKIVSNWPHAKSIVPNSPTVQPRAPLLSKVLGVEPKQSHSQLLGVEPKQFMHG
ncbi:hypothetical protein Nmel_005123 [Mimus melanotis]